MTSVSLKPAAQRVQAVLEQSGAVLEVREFPASTRTAEEAAAAIGCQVEQIAKSLIFRTKQSDRPLLAVVRGVNRADEKKLEGRAWEAMGEAEDEVVRAGTGVAIGGVRRIADRD